MTDADFKKEQSELGNKGDRDVAEPRMGGRERTEEGTWDGLPLEDLGKVCWTPGGRGKHRL